MSIPSDSAFEALNEWILKRIKYVLKDAQTVQWNQELENWAMCVKRHRDESAKGPAEIDSGHHDIPPIPLVVAFFAQVVSDYKNVRVKYDMEKDQAKIQAAIIQLIVGEQQTVEYHCNNTAESFETEIAYPEVIRDRLKRP